jgi:hypothetical protein
MERVSMAVSDKQPWELRIELTVRHLCSVSFEKLFKHAGALNMRFVAINRRNYAGTTKHTDAEVTLAYKGDPGFFKVLAEDVSNLLVWVIDELNPSKKGPDGKSGGLAVLSWSMGTPTMLSLFGHAEAVQAETFDKIEPYLRRLIIYGKPFDSARHMWRNSQPLDRLAIHSLWS